MSIIVHTRLSEAEHEELVCSVAHPDEEHMSVVLRRLVREAIARSSTETPGAGSRSPQESRSPSP